MSRFRSKENLIIIITSLAILLYLAIPLFKPGLPANNDKEVYLTWLTEFEKNIHDGNLIPRWAPNLWHGFGSPLFIFVSPGFYYLSEIFRLFSLGILLSVKIAVYLSLVIGFIFTFLLAKKLWGRWPALLCATVYTFMPYHLGLVTARGDYAELLAMALWPVNLFIFYNLIKTRQPAIFLAGVLTIFFQMLAHNILSVIFIPVLLLFIYFYTPKPKKAAWLPVTALLLGFLMAAFFWLPAFLEKSDLNLAELTEGITMNVGHYDYHQHFVGWKELVAVEASDYYDQAPKFLSYLGLIIILISFYFFFKKFKDKDGGSRNLFFGLILLLIGTIMATSFSRLIWDSLPVLKLFQYPTRWLSLTSLAVALLAGVITYLFKDKQLKIFSLIFSLIFVFTAAGYTWPGDYHAPQADKFYQPADSLLVQMVKAADSGKFLEAIDSINLYAVEPSIIPKNVHIPTMQLLRSALILEDAQKIRDGQAVGLPIFPKIEHTEGLQVVESEIKSTEYRIKVSAEKEAGLIINTLYFPGWRVFLDGQYLAKEKIAFNNKLQTFGVAVPAGEHQIIVKFTDTTIRTLGKIISVLSLLTALIFFFLIRRSQKLEKEFDHCRQKVV